MIPKTIVNPETYEAFANQQAPTLTFKIDFEQGRIGGLIDEIEALEQEIYCIVRTERYQHLIYSKNRGIELTGLYGQDKRFVLPQLERRIEEALMQDDRILSVSGFKFETSKKGYQVSFTVESIYSKEISITDEVVI